jgi:hypothetical protein
VTKDQELGGRGRMHRAYRAMHRNEVTELRAGVWAKEADELFDFVRELDLEDGEELVDMIRRHRWCEADEGTRAIILHEINWVIAAVRERYGMPPFDDSLPSFSDEQPDEPPTLFETIRRHLFDDAPAATSSST